MIEIRIHGRGGQGAVLASHILARACFARGYYVQVFPQFGVERRGAPVVAFARLDDHPIRVRTHVYTPDHIMILDPALLGYMDVTAGLKSGGWIVINTSRPPNFPELDQQWRIATVDATTIALRHGIGTTTQPIVNTTMAGAFIRATGLASMEHLETAIRESMPERADANLGAAREAYEMLQMSMHWAIPALQQRYITQ